MENENENVKKKDVAKGKIILFVIGVLIGAVISTVAFFVYTATLGASNNASGSSSQQMPGGTPPEMSSGQNEQNSQSGTPPEMPSDQNGQNGQGGTPPEKPSNNSNSENNN